MLCEKHAIPGKTINIWRTEFLLAKAAQVTIAKVVSDEIDNVGFNIKYNKRGLRPVSQAFRLRNKSNRDKQ